MLSGTHDFGPKAGGQTRFTALLAFLCGTLVLVGCSGDPAQAVTGAPTPAVTADQAARMPAASADHSAHVTAASAGHAATDAHAEHVDAAGAHVHDPAQTLPAQPLDDLAGRSLYHLKSAWTDHHQAAVTLPELAGGPAVVVMFYGDCTTACPLLVKSVEEIEAALPEPLRSETRFVMVSFDTERDTPAKLRDYAASKGLDRAGWHWLVGTPLQTRQLATMLGVQYRDAGNGMFAHSNVVSVLDSGGVPVARLEGLGIDLGPAVAAITAAAGG